MRAINLTVVMGLSGWLECAPWLDRDAGYYAILGMEVSESNNGVVSFSVSLAQQLKPLIRAAPGNGV